MCIFQMLFTFFSSLLLGFRCLPIIKRQMLRLSFVIVEKIKIKTVVISVRYRSVKFQSFVSNLAFEYSQMKLKTCSQNLRKTFHSL